jgi:putative ABC transport system permease protein
MTRHLLRLIWNRRRVNALLMLEILLSFLAVLGVVTTGVYYADNYRLPLGFDHRDVWLVESGGGFPPPVYWRVFRAAQDLPQVEAVATRSWSVPFFPPLTEREYEVDGRRFDFEWTRVSDDFAKVLRLEVVRGRWFSREDDGATWIPVVINERLAGYAFGADDPIGRRMPQRATDDNGRPNPEWRVVGVIKEYRSRGELAPPGQVLFERQRIDDPDRTGVGLLVRMRPGTPPEYHKQLVERLFRESPTSTFRVKTLEQWRQEDHRARLTPLFVLGTVVGFLLLMVVLGLLGALWQNVTQRTPEIGLRRAKGATAAHIHRQIMIEVALLSTVAIALGTLVAVQLPLLDVLSFLPALPLGVVAASLVISAAAIYVVTAVCGFYPARLATRVQPAEALHYE